MTELPISSSIIVDTTANPSPLGLCAFGLTSFLLGVSNAGFYPLDSIILSVGIWYGGGVQILCGIYEWKKNNTFGAVAFTSFGCFWLSFTTFNILNSLHIGTPPTRASLTLYLFVWLFFAIGLWIGTFRISRALQVIFFIVIVSFILLIIANISEIEGFHHAAGWVGMTAGAIAVYVGIAELNNELYGRHIFPVGEVVQVERTPHHPPMRPKLHHEYKKLVLNTPGQKGMGTD